MDYSSMKKEELIKLLEDQRHLAQAVEQKDKEILDLKNEKDKMRELSSQDKTKIREGYDKQLAALKEEISNLQSQTNDWQTRALKAEKGSVNSEALVEKNAELVDFGNKYIKMHTNMLQSIQGIIELSSDFEKTLIEKIQKSQKE